MKVLLIIFLVGTSAMLAQKTTVNGITLSYDQKTGLMTLTTPERSLKTPDLETDKMVIIKRVLDRIFIIGGTEYTVSETYYHMEGSVYYMGYAFIYYMIPLECTRSATNSGAVFKRPERGEYILTVSDVCDDKWVTNKASGSIMIK